MTFKTAFASVAALTAASAAPAATEVTSVARDDATGIVTIDYTLTDAPAVVTLDIATNGASIGGQHLRRLAGDVSYKMATNGNYRIKWFPDSVADGFKFDGDVTATVTAWPTNNLPDYMVIDLGMKSKYWFYPNEASLPHGVDSHIYKTSQLVMRKIPAAGKRFRMGSPGSSPISEAGRVAADEAIHYVSFTNDFYLGIYELTQGQAKALIFSTLPTRTPAASHGYGPEFDEYPYDGSKYDLQRGGTAGWPGTQRGGGSTDFVVPHARQVSGLCIDLPFEAEWEFACRAGESAARYNGSNDDSTLGDLAWYAGNSGSETHPVGLKKPNAWGLYDMYGNVQEWMHDWYDRYTEGSEQTNPTGYIGKNSDGNYADVDGSYNRISRGGSCASPAAECRSAFRAKTGITTSAYMGVRLWCKAGIP